MAKKSKNKTKQSSKTKKPQSKKVVNVKEVKPIARKPRRMLFYIIVIIILLFLISFFYCPKVYSLIKDRRFEEIPASLIDNKDLEIKKADLAKEEMLKNYSLEDFNLKIKNTDFEKLTFEKNIPILMYHYIEPEGPTQSTLRRNLGVTPENFEKQMKWLYDNGFKTLTLSQYFSLISEQKEISPKTVLITMDDGYRDFFENAAPILNRYNMTATVFIITDMVDSPAFMTWDQIKLLSSQGFEFGSHTLSHMKLTLLSDDKLKKELIDSREKIEKELGKTVNFFCYPTGAYDDTAMKAVRDAGYRGAFTTTNGSRISNKNMFELPRRRVTHTMSIDGFAWTVGQIN
jgi:peptidoglycan/xylan/chitin deacetylase (PgdA/CDA1 family)